jgi:pyruvate/2-oxoglutarate dehydrogenase complex dihydrolipoamide dehydrogenase (E3) component
MIEKNPISHVVARRSQEVNKTYSLLHEDGELALIFNLDELLAAIGRVGNVQLHKELSC